MSTCTTANFIEDLVVATAGPGSDVRQRYLLRQALHSLVRQAKIEHMLEIRKSVERLTGINSRALRARCMKGTLINSGKECSWGQQEFEFGQDDSLG